MNTNTKSPFVKSLNKIDAENRSVSNLATKDGKGEINIASTLPSNSDAQLKIEREKELKQIKSQVSKAEIEISRLENEIKTIDELLSDPTTYQSIINDKVTFAKYEQMKKQLDTEMTNWEALNTKLEKL